MLVVLVCRVRAMRCVACGGLTGETRAGQHGQTDWNAEKRLQGWVDSQLDATGVRQAALLGQAVKAMAAPATPVVIYSSPLSRAKATAEAIALALDTSSVVLDDRLREMCLGIFQGHTAKAAVQQFPSEWRKYAQDDAYVIPQGESSSGFTARVLDFMRDLAGEARQAQGTRVCVVVAHGGVIDCLRREYAPELAISKAHNASISVFHVDSGQRPRLVRWNLTQHLRETASGEAQSDDVRPAPLVP